MNHPSPLEANFFAALEKGSAEERAAYLDEACAGDPDLRRHVEKMLAGQAQAGSFLEQPLIDQSATVGAPLLPEPIGTVIGPYKLMEQIGEGGMGLVYVAEQHHPVRRKVALKLIKPGMDTRQVIARFEAERQALALMDHPNIARVIDGGATASGRPYFVMELVKGVPITEYCDQNRLTPRARLELFGQVCAAVQHAHQKGIIHRDIKPSNVMIASHDGAPVVKVIDFGVAKAIGQQLTEKTIYTQFTQFVGTPLYMSPEQAGQSALDIDTRTDIYAMGVLLYELLTGTTPFDKERLSEASYDEIRRLIREEEPPKPSTRLSTLGLAVSTISAQRQSNPKQLCLLLRGEVDWIVMKSLEKDRNRRYESASALAADVERYLKDEPVQACPPSRQYRLGKFLRKHRAGVLTTAGALIVTSVLGGGIVWVALDRAALRTEAERQRADTGQAVATYLQEVARWEEKEQWKKALDALGRANVRLEGRGMAALDALVADRREQVTRRQASNAYFKFWDPRSDSRQVASFREELELSPDSTRSYGMLGWHYLLLLKLPEAERAIQRAIKLNDREAGNYHVLGQVLYFKGELSAAEEAASKAVKRKNYFPNGYSTLATILFERNKLPEAEAAKDTAFKQDKTTAVDDYGYLLMGKGRFVDALMTFKQTKMYHGIRWATRYVELDAQLSKIQKGESQPAHVYECFALAELCHWPCRQFYAASARFYADAFADDPFLIGERRTGIRYDAACAAARAGCGQGNDAADLDASKLARLRRQSLVWLQADLAGWRSEFDEEPRKARNGVQYEMAQWQSDSSFDGVRGANALAKLPEGEREQWRKLWQDVGELKRRADALK